MVDCVLVNVRHNEGGTQASSIADEQSEGDKPKEPKRVARQMRRIFREAQIIKQRKRRKD